MDSIIDFFDRGGARRNAAARAGGGGAAAGAGVPSGRVRPTAPPRVYSNNDRANALQELLGYGRPRRGATAPGAGGGAPAAVVSQNYRSAPLANKKNTMGDAAAGEAGASQMWSNRVRKAKAARENRLAKAAAIAGISNPNARLAQTNSSGRIIPTAPNLYNEDPSGYRYTPNEDPSGYRYPVNESPAAGVNNLKNQSARLSPINSPGRVIPTAPPLNLNTEGGRRRRNRKTTRRSRRRSSKRAKTSRRK